MSALELFFKLALFFQNGYFVFLFVIWGVFYYDRNAFLKSAVVCLCTSIINYYLKTIFQVPLNAEVVGHAGWAFPSGHAALNTSLWVTLILEFRKKSFIYGALAILPIGFIAMMYFGYHSLEDVAAGFSLALSISLIIHYCHKYILKNTELLFFTLFLIATVFLYLIPTEEVYPKLYASLGMILGIACYQYLYNNHLKNRLVYYKKRSIYYIIGTLLVLYGTFCLSDIIDFDGKFDNMLLMFLAPMSSFILIPMLVNRFLRERVKQVR